MPSNELALINWARLVNLVKKQNLLVNDTPTSPPVSPRLPERLLGLWTQLVHDAVSQAIFISKTKANAFLARRLFPQIAG